MGVSGSESGPEGLSWLWSSVLIFFILFSLYSIWPYIRFYRLFALPGPTPWPFFGNMVTMARAPGLQVYHEEKFKKYGKYFRIFIVRTGEIVIKDLDMIKEILLKNFWSFRNRRVLGIEAYPFDRALTTIVDSDWKHSRAMITPTFSSGKLKSMLPLLHRASNNLLNKMDEYGKTGEPTQMRDVFGCYVMDTIASTAFGLDVDCQSDMDNDFVKNAKNTFNDPSVFQSPILLLAFFFPCFNPLLNYFQVPFVPKEKTDFFINVTNQAIEMKKENSDKRVDFLSLMIKAHELYSEQGMEISEEKGEKDESKNSLKLDAKKMQPFTNNDIISHALIFFLAGYETTTTAMSFMAYCLATNPEIQNKLVEEIDAVTEGREDFSYGIFNDMPYLEMVFCETLRMFPPAVALDRVASEDITIKDIFIPKDTIITVEIFSIHRDPENYPDPEKFIPERFTKEEKEKRHPLAYMPFGHGLRNCIGMRFAILEAKLGMVRVLQKMTFDTCEETQIPPKLGGVGFTSPPDGITLKLVPRKKTE